MMQLFPINKHSEQLPVDFTFGNHTYLEPRLDHKISEALDYYENDHVLWIERYYAD